MPRGADPYDEAKLQGRLWTPTLLRPAIWLDPNDLSTITLVSGNLDSIKNKGDGPTLFNAASSTQRFSWVFYRSRYWARRPVDTNGMVSNTTFSLMPSGKRFTGVTIVMCDSNTGIQIFSQYPDDSAILLAMNFGSSSFDFCYYDGTWCLLDSSKQPMPRDQITLCSQRRDTDTSVIARYQQPGLVLEGTMTVTNKTASNTTIGWGGHVGYPLSEMGPLQGPLLYFNRELNEDDVLRCEGYLAWAFAVPEVLKPSHPFRNRPPLRSD